MYQILRNDTGRMDNLMKSERLGKIDLYTNILYN